MKKNKRSLSLIRIFGSGFIRIGQAILNISKIPSEDSEEIQKWINDNGDQILRQRYDLNENSIVFDLGGFIGQWSSDIYSRYRCKIFCFEVLSDYSLKIEERFKKNHDIKVFNFGLSSNTREVDIYLHKDGTTISPDKYKNVNVSKGKVVDFIEFIQKYNIHQIDLVKINIEGAEYELLEYLLSTKTIKIIKNIQVQFHNISSDSDDRMQRIQNELSQTHKLTYQYKFVWENWLIK
jgi:FkbM family methyltransferase